MLTAGPQSARKKRGATTTVRALNRNSPSRDPPSMRVIRIGVLGIRYWARPSSAKAPALGTMSSFGITTRPKMSRRYAIVSLPNSLRDDFATWLRSTRALNCANRREMCSACLPNARRDIRAAPSPGYRAGAGRFLAYRADCLCAPADSTERLLSARFPHHPTGSWLLPEPSLATG